MPAFGICQLTLIPIRKEPTEQSEMVNQLLFGETVEILSSKGSWSHIRTHFDEYEGWLNTNMITLLDEKKFKTYQSSPKIFLKAPFFKVSSTASERPVSYIPGGSTLLEENDLTISENILRELDTRAELHHLSSKVDIIGTAFNFLNAPYLWGGRTIFGIDCSGFTQIVFKMNGQTLPRDAGQQAKLGKNIGNIEEARSGDLAFFCAEDGRITHTGIIIENYEIIHASGCVHIEKLDKHGILNATTMEYSYKLSSIKRLF